MNRCGGTWLQLLNLTESWIFKSRHHQDESDKTEGNCQALDTWTSTRAEAEKIFICKRPGIKGHRLCLCLCVSNVCLCLHRPRDVMLAPQHVIWPLLLSSALRFGMLRGYCVQSLSQPIGRMRRHFIFWNKKYCLSLEKLLLSLSEFCHSKSPCQTVLSAGQRSLGKYWDSWGPSAGP